MYINETLACRISVKMFGKSVRHTRDTRVLYACYARLTLCTKARGFPLFALGLHIYYQLMAFLCIPGNPFHPRRWRH